MLFLDNFESVMDAETDEVADPAVRDALTAASRVGCRSTP